MDDLREILLLDFPLVETKADTFMDLANVVNHENTISHIYSYFLNREKNQLVAELFLSSLIDVVKQKKQDFDISFNGHHCYLEYSTKKGNRIDLVISSDSMIGTTHDSALIIENKIYSWVHNDLCDYYNSVEAKNKLGILLTVWPEKLEDNLNDRFVNILHSEWIEKIKSKGLPPNLTTNKYIYLNDFLNNMENLYTKSNMDNDTKFFFENSQKIIRATQTMEAAFKFIGLQLEEAAQKMQMEAAGNGQIYRHIWRKDLQVYYAIVIDSIVYGDNKTKKPTVSIYLEIYKEALKKEEELRKLLSDNDIYSYLNDDKASNSSWAHLAFKEYELNITDIETLGEFIADKIKADFHKGFDLVNQYLNSK